MKRAQKDILNNSAATQSLPQESKSTLPPFLEYLNAENIANEEFYTAYGVCDDVPLWWKRDVIIPKNSLERKNEQKKQNVKNMFLEKQFALQSRLNEQYEKKLAKEAAHFKIKIERNAEFLRTKEREQELNSDINALQLKREQLEKENELIAAERSHELAKVELQNQQLLQSKQLKLLEKEQVTIDAIAGLSEAIAQKYNDTQKVADAAVNLRSENIARAKIYNYLPTATPSAVVVKADSAVQSAEKSGYNNRLALVLKNVFLVEAVSQNRIFSGLDITAQRNMITVLYSQSKTKLQLISQIICNNISSAFTLKTAEVLIFGENPAVKNAADCQKMYNKYVVKLSDIKESLVKSKKKLNDFIKKTYSITAIATATEALGLSSDVATAKPAALSEDSLNKLCLAVALANKEALVLLEMPEDIFDSADLIKVIQYVGRTVGVTILITTTSLIAASKLSGSKVYKI